MNTYKAIAACKFKNANIVEILAVFLSLAFVYSTYEQLFHMRVYGYDEAKYYIDFSFKLVEDGRWLNHILLDILRLISLKFWAIFYVIGLFCVMYAMALNAFGNNALAVVVASSVITTTPYVHQSIWPATSSVGIIIFLFLLELHRRRVGGLIIYLIAGVLFFGTLQSFYFLVPLMFLDEFLNEGENNVHRNLTKHFTFWLLGAVAGVLFMSAMVWLIDGKFGVSPAAWRRIQPILSFPDFIRNINYVGLDFQQKIIGLCLVLGKYFFGFWLLLILINGKKFPNIKFNSLLLLIAVGLSFFAFSVPLAPVIQERSLFALATSFVYVVVVSTWRGAGFSNFFILILLLHFNYKFTVTGLDYLQKERLQKNHIIQKIEAGMPRSVLSYKGVVQFGFVGGSSIEAKIYDSAPIMHGLFHGMNFNEYKKCGSGEDSFCRNINIGSEISRVAFAAGYLIFNEAENDWLVVQYK